MGANNCKFKEHIYSMCLNRKLYLATIQLQADMRLGKAYSALLPFVTGLHSLGYLSDEDYELYKNKYSVPLDVEPKTQKQLILEETKKNRNRKLNRHFGEVLAQWSTLKESAKTFHLKEAAKHKNLKNACLILELGEHDRLELS